MKCSLLFQKVIFETGFVIAGFRRAGAGRFGQEKFSRCLSEREIREGDTRLHPDIQHVIL